MIVAQSLCESLADRWQKSNNFKLSKLTQISLLENNKARLVVVVVVASFVAMLKLGGKLTM